ncbi:MAG TPA: thioredoxin family protein [Flavobacterium sp.]|jgi:hypothetical protein
MKVAVAKCLANSYSYTEYRKIVSDLLSQDKSSGKEQSPELTHYSLLNETRMNRLDKTIIISEDIILKMLDLKKSYTWLVLSEGWCGDAAQILPVLHKMSILTPNIEMKVAFRDENEELMSRFLTNGSKSIPKLIVIDKSTLNVCGHWGPRPKGAAHLIKSYKEQYGILDETAKTELQLWYFHDKGASIQNEVMMLMLEAETSCYAKR